jgi:purine nucleoside phosphorylase
MIVGSLAEALTDKECLPYEKVPHFPLSTVRGHAGQLVFGLMDGVPVMCMQGRCHYYEGVPVSKVGLKTVYILYSSTLYLMMLSTVRVMYDHTIG